MNITCPSCKKEIAVETVAVIPKTQTVSLHLECESPMFPARAIGKTILNMQELYKSVSDRMEAQCEIFIQSIDLQPHKITICFQVVRLGE